MADPIIRYVVTHIDLKTKLRTLAHPCQGRHTYATAEEAQAWIAAAMEANGEKRLRELFGFPLEVRPVECWPNHFDPKTCWFES
jgi:hypothetical protein